MLREMPDIAYMELRVLHFLLTDYTRRQSCFIHIPLLTKSGGSGKNSAISLHAPLHFQRTAAPSSYETTLEQRRFTSTVISSEMRISAVNKREQTVKQL